MSKDKLNSLSYTSHARLKVLLVPLRPIKRSRFEFFVELIRIIGDVRLEDVKTDPPEDYNHFDARRVPSGRVLYDYVLQVDREHSYLDTFEYSRRVFAVILIGDGKERHDMEELASQILELRTSVSSSILFETFIFDRDVEQGAQWPMKTQFIQLDDNSNNTYNAVLRDALVNFTGALLSRMNALYITTRDKTNIISPNDPASAFIRPQLQRVSSFALGDAHITPASSPPPGQERPVRNSLGPGILASSERLRILSVGRAAKLCGDLLLLCGFCSEAVKLFSEAAAIARANSDHLWQAAALEGIGICFVLFSFLDLSFSIPTIAQTKSVGSSNLKRTERRSTSSLKGEIDLIDYLPELHSDILNLYAKSSTTQSDQVPAFVLAESSLRLADFLATVHMAGTLDKRALDRLVLGIELPAMDQRYAAFPPRAEIAAWAMRAYQGPIASLTLPDKVHILSGLASVLGAIGFQRRRALFLREILLILTPALIQARVAGAAGMGIHPAASLALSESQTSQFSNEVLLKTQQTGSSLASLLEDICQSYGVPERGKEVGIFDLVLSGYGWPLLRNTILRDCMTISEAIPDFEGVLKFSTRILEFDAKKLELDEQVKFVANIPRVMGIIRRSGLHNIEVDYWDHFLLRGVEVLTRLSSLPVKRDADSLVLPQGLGVLQDKNPFLYNPFERKSLISTQNIMVQGEPTDVRITLQNPFLFDVEALSIVLLTSDPDLTSTSTSAYIKAGSISSVVLSCTAGSSGRFSILGCRIQMSGCRPRDFLLRMSPTRSDLEKWFVASGGLFRQKQIGALARISTHEGPIFKSLAMAVDISVNVLPEAPELAYKHPGKSITLNGSVLEGETSALALTLENLTDIPISFLSFSFSDSTEKTLLQAINSRSKQPHEIYELETFLYKRTAFEFKHTHNPSHIPALAVESFTINIFGKRALSSAQITVNYGHIPHSRESEPGPASTNSVPKDLYTRSLTIPLKCIVHHSLDIIHCDILPLSLPEHTARPRQSASKKFLQLLSAIPSEEKNQYQVLVMDIRNSQPQTIALRIELGNENNPFVSLTNISGSSQERLLVPIRRVHLSQEVLNKPIPSLSERQFIVSSVSPDVERAERESFWAREDLLSRLKASWTLDSRSGVLEVRSIHLTKRMVENYLLPPVEVYITIPGAQSLNDGQVKIHQQGTLTVNILNHAGVSKSDMCLRVIVTHQATQSIASQFLILGSSQVPIALTAQTSRREIQFFPLSLGRYAIQASLSPVSRAHEDIVVSPKVEVEVVD